ncbi:MAG: nucleotidyltransferase family protein [Gemmatimonadaceae bacterium]|nr:nucleotidyltransferase family protein [Gemmatimonadaceae bacterium]
MTLDASSTDDLTLGFLWPTGDQLHLLDAALLAGKHSRAAFRAWRSTVDIDQEFGWTVLRMLPLVHDTLSHAGEGDPLMGRLKGVARLTWYETQRLLHRVRPIVAALAEAKISVLMLKGAPMVLSYYRSQSMRPMSDVDICVRERDVPCAMALLAGAGWQQTAPFTEDYSRFRHAMQYRHPDGGELDLHWHAMYEAMLPGTANWGWDDTEPFDFLGVPVLRLRPGSMLLHHVVHGVRWNLETPIRWIPDAVTVLRKRGDDVDWTRLVADARHLRVTMRLRLGLAWLQSRYGVYIPTAVLHDLQRATPTLLERIEARVYLSDHARHLHTAAGNQMVILADLCRVIDPANVTEFVAMLPHYLRFRWNLGGRREIVSALWRALRRRMLGRSSVLEPAR